MVRNPFNSQPDINYDHLIIKLNGSGSVGGYQNGYRVYYVAAKNHNVGKKNQYSYKFFPYLNSEKFNLPTARYIIEKRGHFTVKWK